MMLSKHSVDSRTEFSDRSAAAAAAVVCDVEETKDKRVHGIFTHALRPPRHDTVWFTS